MRVLLAGTASKILCQNLAPNAKNLHFYHENNVRINREHHGDKEETVFDGPRLHRDLQPR